MKQKLILLMLTAFILSSCVKDKNIVPVPVQKERTDKKVFVHMMTWFWTDENNQHPEKEIKNNPWFGHWTMDKCNPETLIEHDPSAWKRQIASHYYPLTGPYASRDKNIIEYQLLLMKLSGIDGIIFNYTTLNPHWDFPALI